MSMRQWSTESIVADHRELQCTSLAVSGDLAVLAGRRYVALVSLNEPNQVLRKYVRNSRWDTTKLAWSPSTSSHGQTLALATNDKIELYSIEATEIQCQEPIKGHCRQITDLCWNGVDPSGLLCSTAGDGSIHVWDSRDYRRPRISFQTMIGANQVEWSKSNMNELASAHEGDVKIWDIRNPNSSILTTSPHLSRIHSVDWKETNLVTSSGDCTVKFHSIRGNHFIEIIFLDS